MESRAGNEVFEFLRDHLSNHETQWSVGTFGAIAEFSRHPHETAVVVTDAPSLSVVTGRGGIRITAASGARLVASESITRDSWSHRIALCLPAQDSVMSRRDVLTELGPDSAALRAADCESVLFDLGLGCTQVDACIRVSDRGVASKLRTLTGRNVFEAGNPVMSIIVPHGPHRVFLSRIGRAEVFQPIPPSNGRSPEGPHTHVLPDLLRLRRTHASTEPIPKGLVPCAYLYPAHPAKDDLGNPIPFDESRHVVFQHALKRFGDRDTVDLKQRIVTAIRHESPAADIAVPDDKFARGSVRVALRQLAASNPSLPALAAWIRAYDASRADAVEADDKLHPHY